MTGDVGHLYAEALFELSLEQNELEKVYNDLTECSKVFEDHPDFVTLLDSPVVMKDEKHSIINKVFGEESGTVHDFICLVTDKNRIRYFGKIAEAFNALYDDHMGIKEMTVVTSVPLKADTREKLILKLEEKSGKKVKLKEEVDPSIIGGIVLKMGNTMIDDSVKGRLESIAKQLKS